MKKPLISVVMVVCNVDRFLAGAIESILQQTYPDFEFIIVDFGSTDGSKATALTYAAKDSRITFQTIPNCTLPEARNAACLMAQGQYIAVMDADDIAVPERLAWEIDFLEKRPEVGFVGGATEWIDATGRALRVNFFPTDDHDIKSALTIRCPYSQPTVLIRKEAFDSVGGYRSVFLQAEDYDLWTRIAERYQCANLDRVVLKYRVHPHQISMRNQRQQALCILAVQRSALARKNRVDDPLDSMKEITPATLADLGVQESEQESVLTAQCRQWIRHMCLAGEYDVALEAANEIFQARRDHVEPWQIADLYVTVAGVYWKQNRFLRSFLTVGQAVATRPAIIGRPFKSLLQRIGVGMGLRASTRPGDSRTLTCICEEGDGGL
jgi:glycosyltransferase involved in cell wall biosynthesis